MYLASEGKSLKTCFKCGYKTHRTQCPGCSTEISSDSKLDTIQARLEAGEDIDLETALKEEWAPVILGQR